MVHPVALAGKTTHSLEDIIDSIIYLIKRYYNRDNAYRDPREPLLSEVYFGDPVIIRRVPCAGVLVNDVNYEDAPQDAGAEVTANMQITLYLSELTQEMQHRQQIRMAESIRHIILDKKRLTNEDGTEQVFQAMYLDSQIQYGSFIKLNFEEEEQGFNGAILNFKAVFGEMGY